MLSSSCFERLKYCDHDGAIMPTGACGIDCDVCRLRLLGICSRCGPGKSLEAEKKMAAQVRIFGFPCPVLACAHERGVAYCLRDCHQFPCELFQHGPYPYSDGFLKMQERRRKDTTPWKAPTGDLIKVPAAYWEELSQRDLESLCQKAVAEPHPPEGLTLPFLGEVILVDRDARCLKRPSQSRWEKVSYPLMELLFMVYLLNVGPEPLTHDLVSVQEMKTAHFFQGPHALDVTCLIERYSDDLDGFQRAAESLGGEKQNLADAAFRIPAFPKAPLFYLLWAGDDEFEARISVLFDRSVEEHLSADAIWGLVHLVSDALIRAPELPF